MSDIESKREIKPKLIIIGAGLVGCLAAKYLVKAGYEVIVYELRNDIRKMSKVEGRSINLALSNRGLVALENAGIDVSALKKQAVPMKGRVLHNDDGKLNKLPYDVKYKRSTYSISRNDLNKFLLTETEKIAKINFGWKTTGVDFKNSCITLVRLLDNKDLVERYDYLVGCDGAHSIVRQHMIKTPLFNYTQTYIEHGYMELKIDAKMSNEKNMPRNYLHIWPRDTFMMIALPNYDGSWTVTLFMPFKNFANIGCKEELLKFFQKYFPDSLPLIGKENLVEIFFSSSPQPLVSVNCSKYNLQSRVLIIGDAAHAVVPFYGQGMNAGFEDCYILYKNLQKCGIRTTAFEEFSKVRTVDGHAISELSMYNYLEMRNLVKSNLFLLNKKLDDIIYKIVPALWHPLYICVTFSDIPYSECIKIQKLQKKILSAVFFVICLGIFITYIELK